MICTNEILFKNRNKLYGAYDLRKKYPGYAIIGLLGSLVILAIILSFVYYLIYHDEFASLPKDDYLPDASQLINIQKFNLPDLEKLNKPDEIKPKEESSTLVVKKDAKEEIIPQPKDEIVSPGKDSTSKTKDIAANDSVKKQDTEEDPNKVLSVSDEMPEYMQGADELRKFIFKNTIYPDSALKRNIQGLVLVQFIVTKHGEVKSLKLIKSASPMLDSEAMRVARMITNWKPGRLKGKPVNVQYVIPFNFKI